MTHSTAELYMPGDERGQLIGLQMTNGSERTGLLSGRCTETTEPVNVSLAIETRIILFIAFSICIYGYRRTKKMQYVKKALPSPLSIPLIGHLYLLIRRPLHVHEVLAKLALTYTDTYRLNFGSKNIVVLNSLKSVKEIFLWNTARPSWYLIQQTTRNCKGLVWQNGQSWKILRRFCTKSLRDFGLGKTSIQDCIQAEAQVATASVASHKGEPLDLMPLLQRVTSNVICSMAFGSRFDHENEEFKQLLSLIGQIFSEFSLSEPVNFFPVFEWLPYTPKTRRSLAYMDKVDSFIDRQIEKHRKTFNPNEIRDLIDLYLANEERGKGVDERHTFSDVNMRYIIRDLFIAGSETTATTLLWALLYMAHHPHIQQRCQHHIDTVLGSKRLASNDDRADLVYVVATLNEVQRIRPAVPLLLHQNTASNVTVNGCDVDDDAAFLGNIHAIHMSPDLWDEPEQFRPERFIGPDGDLQNHDGFIAFGLGPRQCLGGSLGRLETFIFFTTMLQHFKFVFEDVSNPPSLDGKLGITLAPNHFTLRAIARHPGGEILNC